MRSVHFAIMFVATAALADDSAARAKLLGRWQPVERATNSPVVWTFENKGSNVLRIVYSIAGQNVSEFQCTATGRECEMTDSGKPAKASMWFNGSKLVQLETKGQDVVKRRFSAAESGEALDVEVIPIVPEGKAEVFHFRRVQQ
jgi:hypothetical protein